jgi:hypothetical protein
VGTTSAIAVNLETCNGCGVSGWGWTGSAYWLAQTSVVMFGRSGTHTIRIQTREDGPEIDQVVLSPETFMSATPGAAKNDRTILAAKGSVSAPVTSTPYGGTPIALPGVIDAAYFDEGGAGLAYSDTTKGNTGGVSRATDVDLQKASVGGHNIAWTAAGEWVTYTVDVSTAATYTLSFLVASAGGGSLQVTASAPTNAAKTVVVPDTGGDQNWTKANVKMALAAGRQHITVKFPSANVNFRSLTVR